MKWNFKRDVFALSIITLTVIIGCYYYIQLPKVVAAHYNGEGIADEYGPKDEWTARVWGMPSAHGPTEAAARLAAILLALAEKEDADG